MKIGIQTLALLLTCTSTAAFAPTSLYSASKTASSTSLHAEQNDKSVTDQVKGVMASTLMAAALWASPPALFNNVEGPAMFNDIRTTVVADAKEMASASGSRVNKDAESLLRLGLPIPKDKEVSFDLIFCFVLFLRNLFHVLIDINNRFL